MTIGRQILVSAVATAVVAGGTYVVVGLMPKTYESSFSILFPASSPSSGGGLSSILGGSGPSAADLAAVPIPGGMAVPLVGSSPGSAKGILESRNARRAVVRKLALDKKWRMTENQAAIELQENVRVRIDDNGFLTARAYAEDPVLAQQIAESLLGHLDSEAVELTLNVSRRNRQALEERLKAGEKAVATAERQLVSARRDHPMADIDSLSALLADGLKQTTQARAAASAARQRLTALEDGYRKALALGGDESNALSAVAAGPLGAGLTELSKQLQARRVELEEAKRLFTERSPEFKQATERAKGAEGAAERVLADARASLGKGSFAPTIVARAELEALEQSVRSYEASMGEYEALLKRSPQDSAIVAAADLRYQSALRNTEMIRTALEQAIVAEARDPARFEVVDEPVENPQAVAPRRCLMTGAAAVLCALACGWWVLRGRLRWAND
jgi:uncharacterized protein involved in exopolysaccharide biosynthesis